jgi:periplasmic protein TonB
MEDIKLIHTVSDYGVVELKKVYHKYFALGLLMALAIHLVIVAAYFIIQSLSEEDETNIATVRIINYSQLGPPPSLSHNLQEQLAVTNQAVKPTVGTPVPVPDNQAPKEQTIASQQEMNQVAAPVSTTGDGSNVQITKDLNVEQEKDPDINEFIPVEKEPQLVKSVVPTYPEMAKRASLEGMVYVKILLSTEGIPKKAVVIKSDLEIFNEEAVKAAMQFIFTPAIQNHLPVEVWVAVPFKFKLEGTTN